MAHIEAVIPEPHAVYLPSVWQTFTSAFALSKIKTQIDWQIIMKSWLATTVLQDCGIGNVSRWIWHFGIKEFGMEARVQATSSRRRRRRAASTCRLDVYNIGTRFQSDFVNLDDGYKMTRTLFRILFSLPAATCFPHAYHSSTRVSLSKTSSKTGPRINLPFHRKFVEALWF